MFRAFFISGMLGLGFSLGACAATVDISPVPSAGVTTDGIAQWRGIEYATAARWGLPTVNPDWETADFIKDGPACPQDGQAEMVEDCLFLNVFAPEVKATDLPVMVWFHGGGMRAGQGGDGPKNFTRDGIIVVTFNYRLGKLGFMDWPGWNEDDPRNFGQADMVAALDWVQSNIARFGGDPTNVTIAGHSAGGMGVQLMMVDPRAEGKFARAWAHAGYAAWPFPKAYNPSDAQRQLIKYGPLPTLASAAELVAQTPHYHLPYIDAPYLREQPIDIFQSGRAHWVPYVAGANSMDGAGTLQGAGYTPAAFLQRIDSPEIRAAYTEDFAVSDAQASQRIFGDLRYWRSSALSAAATDGYLFYYDARKENAPGAYHGQQYDQMFGADNFPMKTALLNFIQTGEPGWPKGEQGKMAVFNPALSLADIDNPKLEQKMDALRNAVKALP